MISSLRGKTPLALLAQARPALPAGSMELCLLPSVISAIESAKIFFMCDFNNFNKPNLCLFDTLSNGLSGQNVIGLVAVDKR